MERERDLQWALIVGIGLVVSGLSGWSELGLRGDDRVYLTIGALLASMGVLLRRSP